MIVIDKNMNYSYCTLCRIKKKTMWYKTVEVRNINHVNILSYDLKTMDDDRNKLECRTTNKN